MNDAVSSAARDPLGADAPAFSPAHARGPRAAPRRAAWPASWHGALCFLKPRTVAWFGGGAGARPERRARLEDANAQAMHWWRARVRGFARQALAPVLRALVLRRPARSGSALAGGWRRAGSAAVGVALAIASVLAMSLPATLAQQAVIGAVMFGVAAAAAWWLRAREGVGEGEGEGSVRRARQGVVTHCARLVLIALALGVSGRYAWWRVTETLHFPHWQDAVAGYLLLAAEAYLWLVLPLGCLQALRPLGRRRAPLPAARETWPSVDVFIPTYNEPLSVVMPTVLAAQQLDWPEARLRVHLLDDGRREAFARFAREAGVNYVTRPDNRHAKAGNINHALARTEGEFVAVFDCDHIPTRDFLVETLGWMLRRPDCALVQTPHHFFSRDPIERNLSMPADVPNEGVLFYGLIQDGNDLWDSTFFCGSCAVLRRAALAEVGGVAVETVTEDAHTALKMHRRGWTSAYLPRILAAGLATESLSGHIGQRMRWARGTAQILRTDNPLFGRGLSLAQRLCYLNAMLYFFNGLPRLVLLAAPAAYLVLGLQLLDCSPPLLLAYLLPYMLVNKLVAATVHGPFRSSSWGTVYESILAWFIAWPTLVALVLPSHGRFNVTAKGGRIEQDFFDWDVALPYLVMIAISGVAFACGLALMWRGEPGADPLTLALNTAWVGWNLLVLGVTLHVAAETRQVRRDARVVIAAARAVRVVFESGPEVAVRLANFSLGGFGLEVKDSTRFAVGTRATLVLHDGRAWQRVPVRVARVAGRSVGVEVDAPTLADQRALVAATFGRPGVWDAAAFGRYREKPWQSQWRVLRMGFFGYERFARLAWRSLRTRRAARARSA